MSADPYRILVLLAALLAPAMEAAATPGEDFLRTCRAVEEASAAKDQPKLEALARQLLDIERQVPNSLAIAKALATAAERVRQGGGDLYLVADLGNAAVDLGRKGDFLQENPDLFSQATESLMALHRNAEALALCEERLRIAEDGSDEHELTEALWEHGNACWNMDRVELALRSFNRAIPIARRLGDHRRLAFLLLRVARVHERVGDAPASVPIQREAVEAARLSKDPAVIAEACARLGFSLALETKSADGAGLIDEARRAITAAGQGVSGALASIPICKYYKRVKDLPNAEAAARTGIEQSHFSGQNDAAMACGAVLVEVLDEQARQDEAIAAGEALLAEVPPRYFTEPQKVPFQERVAFAQLCEAQSRVLNAARQHERALELFHAAAGARSVDLEERHKLDIASQAHRLEAAEKESQIRALDQLRHVQQLQLDKERLAREHAQQQAAASRREVWSLTIIVILSAGLCGVMLHRARHQRRIQALLKEQNERLEHLNQEKDEFLAIAAHDLKSPLGGIQRACEMIAGDRSVDSQFTRELALDMAGSAARMFHLITRLLDLHRIEHANSAPTLGPCNVGELCRSLVEEAQPRAREKDIALTLAAPEEPTRVIGEPIRISQIVENLLSNALKFSPPGKSVAVEVREAKSAIEIMVADQGPGIAPEDRSKLFKKFARLSARPTNGEHSSGLGLAIVRAQVETLGGEIRVESEPDRGARFIVRLQSANPFGPPSTRFSTPSTCPTA